MFMGPSSTTVNEKIQLCRLRTVEASPGVLIMKGIKQPIKFNCKSRCYILFTELNAGFYNHSECVRNKLAFQFVQRPYLGQ